MKKTNFNFNRFKSAQEKNYQRALKEVKEGRKRSHWMWFIFPQLHGLGKSRKSKHYGIVNLEEAKAYLAEPVLGQRLVEISEVLSELPGNIPGEIFGHTDSLKLKSCMTLFNLAVSNAADAEDTIGNTENAFQKVLNKFFNGESDVKTFELLGIEWD